MTTPFEGFSKIARFSREVIVTEKIDGTNAQVFVDDEGHILAGSRTRWVTPEDDNFGFAAWVQANAEELRKLGPGHHFGEWWGAGSYAAPGFLQPEGVVIYHTAARMSFKKTFEKDAEGKGT